MRPHRLENSQCCELIEREVETGIGNPGCDIRIRRHVENRVKTGFGKQ